MWLFFSVCSPQGEQLTHSLYAEIEVLMDVLSEVAVSPARLLSAYLVDGRKRRTYLPLEAFDGAPIGDEMRTLQKDYLRLLGT